MVNWQLFEIQFLNCIVRSKSAFEHAVVINSASSATHATTGILCAVSPTDATYFVELDT